MKIIFKENDKIKNHINLTNVFLSEQNPRYTLLNSFEDLTSFIVGNNEKNEDQIFKDLLMSEGDFSDLVSLLENILNFGFQNKNEPIYLINNNQSYCVAEGNRRIMCLKLINKSLTFPNFDELITKYNNYQNVKSEYIIDDEEEIKEKNDYFEKKKTNYSKCQKIVEKIIQKYNNFEVYVKIVDDSNELWKMIYDKHLTGERPGMRRWSRSKSFADLLNLFPDGISINNEEQKKKAWLSLNRDLAILIRDFKEAQFIYSILYFSKGYNNNKEFVDDFTNQNILKEMINLESPSSLEMVHSFNKIRNHICQDILNIEIKEFKNDYISIQFDKELNRLNYKYDKIKPSKMCKFIFEQYQDNVINTRAIKDKNKFLNDVKLYLLNDIDQNNKLTIEQLKNINEFEIDFETLSNIYETNMPYHDEKDLKRFKMAIDLRKENKKFLKILESKFLI